MRKVGEITQREDAERFKAFLAAEKITCELREGDAGGHALWVYDEDLLPVAIAYWEAFVANPAEPRFNVRVVAPAPKVVAAPQRRRATASYYQLGNMAAGKWTLVLIALCVGSTFVSNLPSGIAVTRFFYFSEYMGRNFPEIRDGEIWRLVTPIFLHGGWLHLIFNMMWLFQLGGMIEVLEGPRRLMALVLVLAVLANTMQYVLSGPSFIGMSGVVYGLLGYIWMMSMHAPASRYVMPTQTVYFMIVWMIVCLVGIVGNVANAEHVTGFAVGTLWGFLRSGYIGTARRRQRYKNKQ